MKIELTLTEEQFKRMLKVVYLGNFMVNGVRTGGEDDPRMEEYDEIEEIFLKLAYENGHKEVVHFDIRTQKYFPTQSFEFDDEISAYIDEYNDETLWQELGSRLAERDIMEKIGEEEFLKLDETQGLKMLSEAEEKYFEEFEENGIDNLHLIPSPAPGENIH